MADYDKLVKRAVSSAFERIGTLATLAVFTNSAAASFNFSTAEVVSSTPSYASVRCVMESVKKEKSSDTSTVVKRLLLPAEGTPDLKEYDTVTVSGETWSVVKPIESDGYLLKIQIVRGA